MIYAFTSARFCRHPARIASQTDKLLSIFLAKNTLSLFVRPLHVDKTEESNTEDIFFLRSAIYHKIYTGKHSHTHQHTYGDHSLGDVAGNADFKLSSSGSF